MSIFGTINSLNAAMQAFTYGQSVTSSNIANSTTPGYATQTLDLSATAPQDMGGLSIGSGVTATGVANTRNAFLDNQLRLELGQLGFQNARLSSLQQIEALFPEVANSSSTSGLQGAIANLSSAWTALAAAPTSATAQAAVLTDMQTLAKMMNTDSQQLYSLQRNLDTQVNTTITQANSLLDQVVTLNKEIQLGTVSPTDGQPNALVDQREQVAEQLSQLIGSTATISANGTMVISLSAGTLADGVQAYHLAAMPSTVDQGFTGVGYMQYAKGTPIDISSSINSGTLGGLLTARDQDVMGARQALDKMAFGVISFSNQVNDSFVATDGSTSHNLFDGTKASDIQVDANIVANPSYIGGTRDVTGDLATLQASLQSMDMYQQVVTDNATTLATVGNTINPALTLGSQAFTVAPAAGGTLTISAGGNSASATWTNASTLNDVIAQINSSGGGAIQATFDAAAQVVRIFSSTPATVFDSSGNLGQTLMLSSELTSSAPVNNGPVITAQDSLKANQALKSAVNKGNIFTQASTGAGTTGTATVDGVNFNWTTASTIFGINALIAGADPTLAPGWNPTTQTLTIVRSGYSNPGILTPANPMTPISFSDVQGNLSKIFNLGNDANASSVLSGLVGSLSGEASNAQVLATQAQNLVSNTNSLQAAQSAVDLNAQLAQANSYKLAYEAAARMQYVLDDMLNYLINQMGSSSSSTNSVLS
jgi:flagellar hook-associated protein FlgK